MLDKDTKKIFEDGEKLKSLVESSGWKIARAMMIRRIAEQTNLMNLDQVDPNMLVQVIAIKQEVAKELSSWIAEIEGEVDKHKANINTFKDVSEELVLRLDKDK